MNVTTAARRLGVSPRTVWRWIKSGRLETWRVARTGAGAQWEREITIGQLHDAERRGPAQ